MKNTSEISPSDSKKPKKPSGPFRWNAVIPILVIFAIIAIYFHFLFDANVRSALEWVGSRINGAEVDVGAVKTSFLKGSLLIADIQVTNKTAPTTNSLQVGAIRFHVLWDALLRAKVVVDDASIVQIEVQTPRKHPGFVIPPTPPDGKPSALEQVEKNVLKQAEEQYNQNLFGDIASLLEGGHPEAQLKELEGRLKTPAIIQALQKDVDAKKKAWDERLKMLPQKKDLDVYQARLKALKFDISNPGEFAKSAAEAQKIIQEADQKIKLVSTSKEALTADLKELQASSGKIDEAIKDDTKDIQTRLKIPTINAKDFSERVFIRTVEQKVGGLAKYIELARHYMPAPQTPRQKAAETKAKQEAKNEEFIPHRRGKGHTYRFPITTGYPLFWLKHAEISSQSSIGAFAGDLKGELRDISSDPAGLKKPMTATLSGDFPNQHIQGFKAQLMFDHTTPSPREEIAVEVSHYEILNELLTESKDFGLQLAKATTSLGLKAQYQDDQLQMVANNEFKNTQFTVTSGNALIQKVVEDILKGLPSITLRAEVRGSFNHLDFKIESNLGEELSRGFKKQIQAQVDKLQQQVHNLIGNQIQGPQKQLQSQIAGMQSGLLKNLQIRQTDLDAAKKVLQSNSTGGGKGGSNPIQDLRKQFGF
jgi:uncharacterized protein (TIGR03545 family)